nr:hypothetical protein [Tanacetum cinerariifolium]
MSRSVPERVSRSVPEGVSKSVHEGVSRSVPEGMSRSVPKRMSRSVPEGAYAPSSMRVWERLDSNFLNLPILEYWSV